MYTKLCVYLGAGIFTMIVFVYFHDNQSSQYWAKYDDKLMHITIVLHELVEKSEGCPPTTYLVSQGLYFSNNKISISLS